ncbi:MAG: pyridoxal-phosphate dependent enzyme [Ilumatobacteraceae bacterium]
MPMVSLGEGNTPILSLTYVAQSLGLDEIYGKAEWMNPTGSYKDRIAAATINDAIRRSRRGWIGTSSGNGGASMSAYGAKAGLPGYLCIAADAPDEKIRSIIPYGATLLPMSQLGITEMDAISQLADEFELKLSVTAYRYNPEGMSGAESIGAELRDQGQFSHVYVPTGGGGLLVAIARGMGRTSTTRIICAQPQGCDPIVRFLNHEIEAPKIETCTSKVSGLQLPTPPDGDLAAAVVAESKGWGCSVSDEEAWSMQDLLATREGIFVEPASALAVAALANDVRCGRLPATARPVVILTGSGLKDLRRFVSISPSSDQHFTIDDLRKRLESSDVSRSLSTQ